MPPESNYSLLVHLRRLFLVSAMLGPMYYSRFIEAMRYIAVPEEERHETGSAVVTLEVVVSAPKGRASGLTAEDARPTQQRRRKRCARFA